MANSLDFAMFWAKLTAGLPAAIEAAEVLGALLAPGQKTGPAKLQAVKQGLGVAALVGQAAAPFLPDAMAAIDLAAVNVINSAVAMRTALTSGQASPSAAVSPAVETGRQAAATPTPGPAPDPLAATTPPSPPPWAKPDATSTPAVRYFEGGHVIEYPQPGVRVVDGQRQVWDNVSGLWSAPGR
jgi:hypothetical protein